MLFIILFYTFLFLSYAIVYSYEHYLIFLLTQIIINKLINNNNIVIMHTILEYERSKKFFLCQSSQLFISKYFSNYPYGWGGAVIFMLLVMDKMDFFL